MLRTWVQSLENKYIPSPSQPLMDHTDTKTPAQKDAQRLRSSLLDPLPERAAHSDCLTLALSFLRFPTGPEAPTSQVQGVCLTSAGGRKCQE